jgi:hypothetical protein
MTMGTHLGLTLLSRGVGGVYRALALGVFGVVRPPLGFEEGFATARE